MAQVLGSNGNNLHEAVTDSGEQFLLSMPTKFRKNIWIKRGLLSFVFYRCQMFCLASLNMVYSLC